MNKYCKFTLLLWLVFGNVYKYQQKFESQAQRTKMGPHLVPLVLSRPDAQDFKSIVNLQSDLKGPGWGGPTIIIIKNQ